MKALKQGNKIAKRLYNIYRQPLYLFYIFDVFLLKIYFKFAFL